MDKINFLNSLIEDKEWICISNQDDIITEQKNVENANMCCLRYYSIINAKPEELQSHIWDIYKKMDTIKQFESTLENYCVVKYYDDNTRLCYETNKLPWPLWPRELVYLQRRIRNNGTLYILMYSVEPPEIVCDKNKYVRAYINVSAFILKPYVNKTLLYRVMYFDPAGVIPSSLITTYATRATSLIKYLKTKFYNK